MTWPMSPLVHTPRQVSKSTGRLGVSQTVQGQIGPQEPVTQLCPCPTCQIQHAWNRTYDFSMKHILKHILAPYWVMLIVSLWYDLMLFRTEDRCRLLKCLRWNSESTMHHVAPCCAMRHVTQMTSNVSNVSRQYSAPQEARIIWSWRIPTSVQTDQTDIWTSKMDPTGPWSIERSIERSIEWSLDLTPDLPDLTTCIICILRITMNYSMN